MLKIPRPLLEEIQNHCEEGYPFETCGFLLGKRSLREGSTLVTKIFIAKNLNSKQPQDQYELDPKDFLKADTLSRLQHIEIIGFFHSHPDHPPEPSKMDCTRAWEGYSYFILGIYKRKLTQYKSWRLQKDLMLEETVEVFDG